MAEFGATKSDVHWKLIRRAYFSTYCAASLFSAGSLMAKGYFCTSEADLVCLAPVCQIAQAKCNPMVGYKRVEVCCYNGSVLPCHIRFWFVLLNWISLLAQCAEKAMRHDLCNIQDTMLGKEGLQCFQGATYTIRHFLDKAGQIWATIMLLQAYLSLDPFAYIMALLNSETCVFLFNVSFVIQLGFVVLDTVTTGLLFVMWNLHEAFCKPISKVDALAESNRQAYELEERANRRAHEV